MKNEGEIISNGMSSDVSAIPIFDLTKLNLLQLAEDLRQSLDKPRPRSIIFKWWGNKKANLDIEHQRIVLEQITNLRQINSQLENLQADLFLSQRVVSDLIEGRLEAAKRQRELLAKQHEEAISLLDDQMASRQISLLAQQAEVNLKQAEIEAKKAQTERDRAQAVESLARAKFIEFALSNIDVSKLPDTLKTYIVSSIFNPNGTQFNDFDMQEQIKKFVIMQTEAQSLKAIEETKQLATETELKRLKFEREKRKP